MIEAGRECKYEELINNPSKKANGIGRRKPVYVNYTPEGRLKDGEPGVKKQARQQEG